VALRRGGRLCGEEKGEGEGGGSDGATRRRGGEGPGDAPRGEAKGGGWLAVGPRHGDTG
jgi:hypothetical protein